MGDMVTRCSSRLARILIGSLLAGFGLCETVRAQTLAGRVLDKTTGAPLPHVDVLLVPDTGAATPVLNRTTTDSTGIFYLDAPKPGAYRVAFQLGATSSFLAFVHFDSTNDVEQRQYMLDVSPARPYFEFQVEKQVAAMPGNRAPRYPEEMLRASVEGEVLAQFVVDTLGNAEMATFRALRATHPDFTSAVRDAVRQFRFYPAELRGRKVRQLVQMPFDFCLNWSWTQSLPDTGRFWWLRKEPPRSCGRR